MRKSMLTIGSIICLFVLVSISYQPLVAIKPISCIKDSNSSEEDIFYVFYFGKIYNLTYFEDYFNGTLYKYHVFNCSRVLAIFWYKSMPTMIMILKNGMAWNIAEASSDFFDFYFKGYINNNFIFGIQVFKAYISHF